VARLLARMRDPNPPPLQFSLRTLLLISIGVGAIMTCMSVEMPVRFADDLCWIVTLAIAHGALFLLFAKKRNTVRDVAAQRLRFRKAQRR
jgi:hypothetical protein